MRYHLWHAKQQLLKTLNDWHDKLSTGLGLDLPTVKYTLIPERWIGEDYTVDVEDAGESSGSEEDGEEGFEDMWVEPGDRYGPDGVEDVEAELIGEDVEYFFTATE